jgi:capsular exopolysaccharide synthesis family protein
LGTPAAREGPFVPAGLPPALRSAPNAAALLKALRRRWLLALTVGLVCAGAVAAVAWYVLPPPKHTARALLKVAAAPPTIIFATAEARTDFATYQRTQKALIKSRFVLNTALRQPPVAALPLVRSQPDPVQWLERELQVDFSLSPELLRISLEGDRPEELTVVVNAVAKAYMDEVVNKEFNTRQERLEQLKRLYGKFDERIRTKRQTLKGLAEVLGSGNAANLAARQKIALEELAQAQKELANLRSEARKYQVEIAAQLAADAGVWPEYAAVLGSLPRPGLPGNLALTAVLANQARQQQGEGDPSSPGELQEPVFEEYVQADPEVKALRAQMDQLNTRIAEIRKSATKRGFPALSRRARNELQTARKALEARREELRPQVAELLRVRARHEARANLRQLKARLASLRQLEKLLNADVERLAKDTRSLNSRTLNLESLQEDIAEADRVMKKVGREVDALEVERQAPPRITLWEEAYVVQPDSRKRQLLGAGLAGAGTLALVLFGFGWWEFRSRKVHSVDEVVHGLGMRLVGTLPHLPDRARRRLGGQGDGAEVGWQNLLAESVDAARTMVLHASRVEGLRVVMITSAVGGEGKTSLACHLAASLARAGRKTLLVDGDLRKAVLHQLFDQPAAPGFSELLRGESDLAPAVRETNVSGLWLLPAGRCDSQAIYALPTECVAPIFRRLRQDYDFVIVDSCPVLPVADALLIGQHADAVILSVLHEVSHLPKVYGASQRLAGLGIRMLGVVVTGTQDEVYAPRYEKQLGLSR